MLGPFSVYLIQRKSGIFVVISVPKKAKDTFISGFLLSVLGLRHPYLRLGEVPGLHE